ADGQPPATSYLFKKTNSAANDAYDSYLSTAGNIVVLTYGNSADGKTIISSTRLPDGANTNWYHCCIAWNTTRGLELYVNSRREAQDPTATTLMVDGATTAFYIGGSDATPADPFTGKIANEVVINNVCTQEMVDFLYATTIPIPAG
ncbi:LamG domain-containing protein, partial [bacterium]|nr:LamG domain-containing protein [bacterium]